MLGRGFNQLDTKELQEMFTLNQIVNFATRGNSTLDLILTNIQQYSSENCFKLAPLEHNDHCCIWVPGGKTQQTKFMNVEKRHITPECRQTILQTIATIDWSRVTELQDVSQKAEKLQSTIMSILDDNCPVESTRVKRTTKPWFDSLARKLRNAKAKAYKNCNSW